MSYTELYSTILSFTKEGYKITWDRDTFEISAIKKVDGVNKTIIRDFTISNKGPEEIITWLKISRNSIDYEIHGQREMPTVEDRLHKVEDDMQRLWSALYQAFPDFEERIKNKR